MKERIDFDDLPSPEDSIAIRNELERIGWCLVRAPGDGLSAPGHFYTVGLEENFEHPELVITGLPRESAIDILSELVRHISLGRYFQNGETICNFPMSSPLRFAAVDPRYYPDYITFGRWFYQSDDFRTLQVIWRVPRHPLFGNLEGLQTLLQTG